VEFFSNSAFSARRLGWTANSDERFRFAQQDAGDVPIESAPAADKEAQSGQAKGGCGGLRHGRGDRQIVETDEMSYNIVRDPVHIRDLHATLLHALGLEHERLSFKFQGLVQRLTGVEPAKVLKEWFV
jgi:hypothetical protein